MGIVLQGHLASTAKAALDAFHQTTLEALGQWGDGFFVSHLELSLA
jgi:hypothetical protein